MLRNLLIVSLLVIPGVSFAGIKVADNGPVNYEAKTWLSQWLKQSGECENFNRLAYTVAPGVQTTPEAQKKLQTLYIRLVNNIWRTLDKNMRGENNPQRLHLMEGVHDYVPLLTYSCMQMNDPDTLMYVPAEYVEPFIK
jgi:hypothetical protein